MKKPLSTLLLFFISTFAIAQIKYPSLLWEIKKDNQKPSYLYGTMHVSERIAFHLSDVFFEKLLSTDKIALESNPEHWLDEMQKSPEMGLMSSFMGNGMFYSSFSLEPLQTISLKESFMFNKILLNGILYRTYDQMNDYQEDTYLDMFLFQTGKRTNREIVNLEDFTESRELVEKAVKANRNFDPPAWAKKMMMEKPINVLLENAYRDKNLDMIDSISMGTNSEKYNEFMLFKRNDNMVHRMDSIFQKGQTLFIGIGAAHLPGTNGVIEKLRSKGYTVTPVTGEYTQKGKSEKERLDHAFQFSNYTKSTTSDEILSLSTAAKLYEFDFGGIGINMSPDLKNGSFINVIRMKKMDFLRKNDQRSEISKIDSLLFENIPGKIIKKEQTKINGFDMIDVINRTKDGDHQRHWFISTPIEYLLVSMIGKYEFVDLNSQSIRNSLQLKPLNNQWVTTSPKRGGFEVKMPSFHTISVNDPEIAWTSNPQIFGYDPSDDTHYFVIEKSLNDVDYLEDSEFELKRIPYEFLKKLKVDTLNGDYRKELKSFTTEGKINDQKKIHLKSVINGSHYYLLGSTGNESKTKTFFESFKLDPFTYLKESTVQLDTTLNMAVKTQYKPMSSLYQYEEFDYGDTSEKNHFIGTNKTRDYYSDSRQNIKVNYREFDRYESYENIDSLWNEIIDNNKEMFEFDLETKKISKTPKGDHRMDAYFVNKVSNQKVKSAYITNGKYYYSLKTLVPLDYKENDQFIEEFYQTLEPQPSQSTTSIFDKKIDLFLEDINSSEDSIRLSALKSIYQIKFKDSDYSTLINLLETYEFADDEEEYKNSLVKKIANLKHPKVKDFLTNFYRKNTDDSDLQMSVLESFASKETKEDYATMASLMKEDLPLPSNSYLVDRLFGQFDTDKENSASILSELVSYKTIPEYQNQIISLSASLLDSGYIQPNKIKSHRKDFLTLGKLELKRSYSAWKTANKDYIEYAVESEASDYLASLYSEYGAAETGYEFSLLKDYLVLLQPFSNDKEINAFLQKVDGLEVPELMLYSLEQKLKNKDEIPSQLIETLTKEDKNALAVYQIYQESKQLDELPKSITKEKVAKAAILQNLYSFDEEKDSLEFVTTKKASYKDKYYLIYFFKVKSKKVYFSIESTSIHSVGFELDEKENILTDFDQVHYNEGTEYIDEESLKNAYKDHIDRVLFYDKKRISFDEEYYPGMMGY